MGLSAPSRWTVQFEPQRAVPPGKSRVSPVFLTIALVFVLLAVVRVGTKRPWVDEAWFTGPAIDLATHGRFGTPVLEPTGSHLTLYKPGAVLTGIDRHTYWVMPLYPLSLAVWGKLFGFSVFSIRIPSILWGLLLLGSIWVLVRRLGGSEQAASLATAILALEFGFIDAGSDGRMDMMSAALGFAGLAVYLNLRERELWKAVLASHTLCALAVFTHPNGVFAAVGLAFCMLYLDWRRISAGLVAAVAAPYAACAALWGAYILQAPAEFASQFGANSAHRSGALFHPLRAIYDEVMQRYLLHHFLPADGGSSRLKIIGLLIFAAAILLAVAVPELRRKPGMRLLLWMAALRFLLMSVGASWRLEYYLVHAVPFYAAIAGMVGWWLWEHRDRRVRLVTAVALSAYFAVQLAVFTHLVTAVSAYRKKYLPAVDSVRAMVKPDDLVAGSADLAFVMGFYNPQLVDDIWLGRWSGKKPTIVVVDDWYYRECMITKPEVSAYGPWAEHELKEHFQLVKVLPGYSIYRRVS